MRLLKPLAAVIPFVLAACSTLPNGVVADRRLTPPKTYRFLPDKAMEAAEEAGLSNGPYWHGKVEAVIAADLAKKGYALVKAPSSDLFVAFHVITQRGKKTTFLDNYAGYTLSAKEQSEQPELAAFLTAPGAKNRSILIIDVIDPVKREVVWREWAQTPMRDGRRPAPAVLEKRIGEVVHRILAKFPPRG